MKSRFNSKLLTLVGENCFRPGDHVCILLAHNEGSVLKDFIRHYRGFGRISFIIVDDRSDDGTAEFLSEQPDVTVFYPTEGSTYARDENEWRGELLDNFSSGAWAIVPDVDERLIWRQFETRSFEELILSIESEGAEAFYCPMIDFYKNGTLSEQVYSGHAPIEKEFQCFDNPRKDPESYQFFVERSRVLRKWPTPQMTMRGGMRDRIFMRKKRHSTGRFIKRALLRILPTIRDIKPGRLSLLFETMMRPILKPHNRVTYLNLDKIPLIKWKMGSRFYGGTHKTSINYKLSRETGVLMHFPITKGESGVRYTVDRGQHCEDGLHYRIMLGKEFSSKSFFYSGTSVYQNSSDLNVFMRPRV